VSLCADCGFPPALDGRCLCGHDYSEQIRASLYAEGLRCGYPRCCIEEFCDDCAAGRSPAETRRDAGSVSDGSGYVPCSACVEAKRPA
jgi:hypothetical protein